jgi:hypothetical protein
MKKLYLSFLAMTLAAGSVWATTLEDITAKGVTAYFYDNVTPAQLNAILTWAGRSTSTLAATNTIAQSGCGNTYWVAHATEFVTTLPAPLDGCYFKFVVKLAPASASYTIVTASSANIMIGGINENEVDTSDDGPYDADGDTITFADGVAVVGDYCEMISDGTSWYVTGQANADGGVTVTKAS